MVKENEIEKPVINISTSREGWLKQVAALYKSRKRFVLKDDALIGIDPREDTLMKMGLKANLAKREWAGVMVGVGIAGLGAWLIIMAVLDPEPYTKVASVILAGAGLVFTGGTSAIYILTKVKPPNIRVAAPGVFEIYWS